MADQEELAQGEGTQILYVPVPARHSNRTVTN